MMLTGWLFITCLENKNHQVMTKFITIILLSLFSINSAKSQDSTNCQKIGIARLNYIIMKMPEMKQIEAEIKEFRDQLAKIYQSKIEDYDNKYTKYLAMDESVPLVAKENMENELLSLQRSISDFQQEANLSIVRRENSLMQPLQQRVFNSINDVANELNFALILNDEISAIPVTLFYREYMDISDLVLSKIGVKEE